jgi:hypothetical protein
MSNQLCVLSIHCPGIFAALLLPSLGSVQRAHCVSQSKGSLWLTNSSAVWAATVMYTASPLNNRYLTISTSGEICLTSGMYPARKIKLGLFRLKIIFLWCGHFKIVLMKL